MDIQKIFSSYNTSRLTVATLGSHSALEIASGAHQYGFKTLVVAEEGREKTYAKYYKTDGDTGIVDDVILLKKFNQILEPHVQEELMAHNAIFIPHRSFETYLNFDYRAIENSFKVPIFGNRFLLKIEERNFHPNQYDLLREAEIRMPHIFRNPSEIDRPVLVKVLEKERGFERAFFLADSYNGYLKRAEELIQKGIITESHIEQATIEEFIMGVQVNLNYFYSPVFHRLEFLGSDTRRQTNLEGFLRLPAFLQNEAMEKNRIQFEEAGHIAVTVLESMLEDIFELGGRFVEATRKIFPPGIIGPFALQTFVMPGPPKKEFIVFDVSPRMPGSPGIKFTPYGEYLWREPMPIGKRIGFELKNALIQHLLHTLIT